MAELLPQPRLARARDAGPSTKGSRGPRRKGEGHQATEAGLDLLVIVDAVRSGAAAGTVHRIEAGDGPLPAASPGWSNGQGASGGWMTPWTVMTAVVSPPPGIGLRPWA